MDYFLKTFNVCNMPHTFPQVVGVCSSDAIGLVASLGVEPLDYKDPATKDTLIADGG